MLLKLMHKLRPIDVISIVLIVVLTYLKCRGIDHAVDYSFFAIVGFYYGQTLRKEQPK